jgi:diguanylate cyclase
LIVSFIDLDNFKAINDQHGHEAGDKFLEAIAKRLQGVLRSGDLAARLGGDEFIVLVSSSSEIADATSASLQRRLASATRGRFALTTTAIEYNGPSIGIIVAQAGSLDAQALLTAADEAMYEVKRARKAEAVVESAQPAQRQA